MPLAELTEWLSEFGGPSFIWCVKRLSGNDTLANGSHQAGPYLPKEFVFPIFPEIDRTDIKNPDRWIDISVQPCPDSRKVRLVYYNSKRHENKRNGRNETRLTNFGGSNSSLLDPESTGALTIFAFHLDESGRAFEAHIWVCQHETEEETVEDRIGPVEPSKWIVWSPDQPQKSLFQPSLARRSSCWLELNEIPHAWLSTFPTGAEVVEKAVTLRSDSHLTPDQRLVKRRECEFEIFRSIEQALELPLIKEGFGSLDDFILRAQTVLQRRKARSGNSLELHARAIFIEEQLQEGNHFAHGRQSEPGKRPDFLFPSQSAYRDPTYPADKLRMLAAKTTCRDRWRQILREADRIDTKHLLTLQEGISEAQFKEMVDAKVQLVVPAPLIEKFPKSVRPYLQTFESFIADVRLLALERHG
ncbi:type II restriction endonuclease [Terrihabitans soli]|uniref:Type II restriction endonuclease n=1 Tax=Terrihabitans soli TaxID=708113 RepID=A0A6S6QNH4_9HYPH|nr:type II restriction endonuclease [Terrihabitans soli]BCJ90509.1 type II restriction endonuclease [Terrihabitans soli]